MVAQSIAIGLCVQTVGSGSSEVLVLAWASNIVATTRRRDRLCCEVETSLEQEILYIARHSAVRGQDAQPAPVNPVCRGWGQEVWPQDLIKEGLPHLLVYRRLRVRDLHTMRAGYVQKDRPVLAGWWR